MPLDADLRDGIRKPVADGSDNQIAFTQQLVANLVSSKNMASPEVKTIAFPPLPRYLPILRSERSAAW